MLGTEVQPGADSQAEIVAPAPSAEMEALGSLGDSPVIRALAELPEQFKTVIYLADIQQYSCHDISGIMGTPLGTVMSRLHRGRQLLRSRLVAETVPAPARLDRVQPDPVVAEHAASTVAEHAASTVAEHAASTVAEHAASTVAEHAASTVPARREPAPVRLADEDLPLAA